MSATTVVVLVGGWIAAGFMTSALLAVISHQSWRIQALNFAAVVTTTNFGLAVYLWSPGYMVTWALLTLGLLFTRTEVERQDARRNRDQ